MMIIPIIVTLFGIMFMQDYAKWYNKYDRFANTIPATLAVVVLVLAGVLWTFYFMGVL